MYSSCRRKYENIKEQEWIGNFLQKIQKNTKGASRGGDSISYIHISFWYDLDLLNSTGTNMDRLLNNSNALRICHCIKGTKL